MLRGSEAPVTESAPREGQPGPQRSPREASFSRLLVPQLSGDEELKPVRVPNVLADI